MAKERLSHWSLSHGATFVEMVVVLALLAVLAGAAVPSFAKLVSRERLTAAQTDLMTSLRYAREQANRSGRRIIVCPSLDGRRCAATTQWEHGWIAGYAGRDSSPHRIQGDPWHVHSGHPNLSMASSQGRQSVVFRATGYASGSNIGILICDPKRAELALQVLVSNSGRVRGAKANAQAVGACHDKNNRS
jgi:type IV fimbrial biogenesis protein FimT